MMTFFVFVGRAVTVLSGVYAVVKGVTWILNVNAWLDLQFNIHGESRLAILEAQMRTLKDHLDIIEHRRETKKCPK